MRKLTANMSSSMSILLVPFVLLSRPQDLSKQHIVSAFVTPDIPIMIREVHHHLTSIQNNAAGTVSHFLSPPFDHSSNSIFPSIPTTTINLASTSSTFHPQDILSTYLSKYKDALEAEPLQTKITTGCTLAVVGDAIAQSREQNYNFKRAASFVAFDGCWRAIQVWTYRPLTQICTGQFTLHLLQLFPYISQQKDSQTINSFLLGAMEQTLVSQLILIPLIYYPIFYATTGLVQGLTVDETIARAKETFIPLMKRNLAFWIPTQFAVFAFVEENLQIPILIVCGLVWTIILSLSAGNASEEQQPQPPAVRIADGSLVESEMVDLGAVEAAMGLNGTSFYFASNISAYFDDEDVGTATNYRNNPNTPSLLKQPRSPECQSNRKLQPSGRSGNHDIR